MRFFKIIMIGVTVIFLFLGFIASVFHYFIYYDSIKKIEIGMSESQVKLIYKSTNIPLIDEKKENSFLCESPQLWYGNCDEAKKSGATYFLTYSVFFDTFAIIGFRNGRVVYKEVGEA